MSAILHILYLENVVDRVETISALRARGPQVLEYERGRTLSLDASRLLLLIHTRLETEPVREWSYQQATEGAIVIFYSAGAAPEVGSKRKAGAPITLSWGLLEKVLKELPTDFQNSDIYAALEMIRRAPQLRAIALLCWVACESERLAQRSLPHHDLRSPTAWANILSPGGCEALLLAATGQTSRIALGTKWENLAALLDWIYPESAPSPGRPDLDRVLCEIERNCKLWIPRTGKQSAPDLTTMS